MKHLELHIIQSVPVACLNRDDLNSPKTTVFGGVQRARVSSQSWKRAIREMAKDIAPRQFKGNRTRRMVYELQRRFIGKEVPEICANAIAEKIADIIETLDTKKDELGLSKIKTMMFFSEQEYNEVVENIISLLQSSDSNLESLLSGVFEAAKVEGEKEKKAAVKTASKELDEFYKEIKVTKNDVKKTIKSVQLKDAADIALFGRMVANDHSLAVEAASMFSHPLSTHKVDNEIDFFAAVDDLQTSEESGAGMTGTLEFNSATYYRFTALNLDMLADAEHLECLTQEERKNVVRTFIESTIKAMPGARKNTMNANTLPVYVLGVVRETGHPIQLVNAFEKPVWSKKGYANISVDLLKNEYAKLKNTWAIEAVFEKAIPDIGINIFLDEITCHVI